MSEGTNNESEKARSFMGSAQILPGGQRRHFVYHFQIVDDQCSF